MRDDRLREGMEVLSLDGQHLGTLERLDDQNFFVGVRGGPLELAYDEVLSVMEHAFFLRKALRVYEATPARRSPLQVMAGR